MSAFRFAVVIIACFVSLVLILHCECRGEGVALRKAATRSASEAILNYHPRPLKSAPGSGAKDLLGLSPRPFKPEHRIADANNPGSAALGLPDIRRLIKDVNVSVVSIRMLNGATTSWRLGLARDPRNKPTGYGAGFIISEDGLILTNEHVLRSGSRIEVELLGGRKFIAKLLAKDVKNDLALIRIRPSHALTPVRIGDSNSVELGEWVVGIGNPYGIGQSIMIGIVSAKRRKIPGSGYPPLIQVDAAMNLGNSGGPLFNMHGEVIGINTILLWKSQGIGFATPSNVALEFLKSEKGRSVRSAKARNYGPLGPLYDRPRSMSSEFNPLDPPWKVRQ